MTFQQLKTTEEYELCDVLEVYDESGAALDDSLDEELLKMEVVDCTLLNGFLSVTLSRQKRNNDSFALLRCNNCMSMFDEEKVVYDENMGVEFCPMCGADGCLMDVDFIS